MEKFFRSDIPYGASTKDVADELKEAKEITIRLMANSYFTDLTEHIDTSEFISIENGRFTVNRKHPNYSEWDNACDVSDEMYEKDKERLFTIMKEKIDGWWD